MTDRKIMEMAWTDEGDEINQFTVDNIGASGETDGEEIAERLNTAADYLVKTYHITTSEARNRLWNQGDCYPRLQMAEEEMK